ncbi:unannotated protein [freshwater metagenome]|uniref:Unannotated protein n=1 Tax=freshwater metagenome TaxID=449393 RepID=A0A6J7J7R2_9ZZZZ
MKLVGRGDSGDPLGLTEQQALILQSRQSTRAGELGRAAIQPVAQASGSGFKADTPVRFYLLPNIPMGELTTNASGAFSGTIPVPANLSPGTYTLQMNALAPSGVVRSLSIGVIVEKAVTQTSTVRANVRFAPLSSALDDTAKAQLRRVAAKAKSGSGVVKSVIVGYVQPTASTSNDQRLSIARAQSVAAYLKSLGVKGVSGVRGGGKATTLGDKGRSVDVAITYRR